MVSVREAVVFSALFGVPCAWILWECVRDPSLFALHPALNAVAFFLCTPAYGAFASPSTNVLW
jgi:hypothetical protein